MYILKSTDKTVAKQLLAKANYRTGGERAFLKLHELAEGLRVCVASGSLKHEEVIASLGQPPKNYSAAQAVVSTAAARSEPQEEEEKDELETLDQAVERQEAGRQTFKEMIDTMPQQDMDEDDAAADIASALSRMVSAVTPKKVRSIVSEMLAPALKNIVDTVGGLLGSHSAEILDKVSELVDSKLKDIKPTAVANGTVDITVNQVKTGEVKGRLHSSFKEVLTILNTRVSGYSLAPALVGPAGSGKTTLAKQLADALNVRFFATGAVMSKYDLIGFVSPSGDQTTLRTPFREAYESGGVFLFDEMDGSDPNACVTFNMALENGCFAFPDKVVKRHADCHFVAGMNTLGTGANAQYAGRNKLDAAFLDRWVRIELSYDEQLERDLVGGHDFARFVQRVRTIITDMKLPLLMTPRQTIRGVALLQAGLPLHRVKELTVWAGMQPQHRQQIEARLQQQGVR